MPNTKKLEDYMNIPYRVNIIPDPDEGGFSAYYPDLPGCMTCVDRADKLEEMLKDAKKAWISSELKQGRDIPEPIYDGEFSGQFKLRIPKSLHKQLAQQAKEEGVSMNQLCMYLLSSNLQILKNKKA